VSKLVERLRAEAKLRVGWSADEAADTIDELVEALENVTDLLTATVEEFGCWTAEDHPKVSAARNTIAKARGETVIA
jgi:hypothetical protein